MGQFRYYLTPSDLVSADEVPKGYGLSWAKGHQISVVRKSRGNPRRNRGDEITFLVAMLRRAQIRIGERMAARRESV